jgi:hypothetical protein
MRSSPEEEVVPGQEVDGEVRLAEDDVNLVGKNTYQDLPPGTKTFSIKGGGDYSLISITTLQHSARLKIK